MIRLFTRLRDASRGPQPPGVADLAEPTPTAAPGILEPAQPDPPAAAGPGQCQAVAARSGQRCRLPAGPDGRCRAHTGRTR